MKHGSASAIAPRRLRDRLKDAARDAILDAAEQVFGRQGIDAPMESIAAQAGVAVGTLYNHFESRAALLDALLAARRKELLDAASAALEENRRRPFAERFLAAMRALVAATERQIGFSQMIFQADLPQKRSRHAAAVKDVMGVFSAVLEEGRREGVLAPDPAGLQPLFLAQLIRAAIGLSLHAPDRLPLAQVPGVVARQFLDGARANRGPGQRS